MLTEVWLLEIKNWKLPKLEQLREVTESSGYALSQLNTVGLGFRVTSNLPFLAVLLLVNTTPALYFTTFNSNGFFFFNPLQHSFIQKHTSDKRH